MLQTRKWRDREGQDRYTTEVVLKRFRGELVLLGERRDREGADAGNGGAAAAQGEARSDLDDEIPF